MNFLCYGNKRFLNKKNLPGFTRQALLMQEILLQDAEAQILNVFSEGENCVL